MLTIKSGKRNSYAHQANILDKEGNVIASVIYRPDNPLKCGARVWIETYNKVVTTNDLELDVAEMVKIITGKSKCAI